VRTWRNAQIDVLRQSVPLSVADQDQYFSGTIRPQLDELRPAQILFALLEREHLIGYGGLVHISWEHLRAEMSFLVDPERASGSAYPQDLAVFSKLMERAAGDLGLHRLTVETFAGRVEHIKALEQAGFALEGRLRDHVRTDSGYQDSLIHARVLDQ
jgi:RimJ/RimL family protein N-acetyltransferase